MEKCWASSLGQCSDKMSREHLVSKGIFENRSFMVKGFKWCKDEYKNVGIESITRKCLCEKHNNLLSEVDNEGIKLFNTLDYIAELTANQGRPIQDKLIADSISGNLLERWFLKTLINLSYNSEYQLGEFGENQGRPHQYIVDVVYGEVPFSNHMGLYSLVFDGHASMSRGEISFTPMIKNNKFIGGAVFTFRGIDFFLSLVPSIPPIKLGYVDIKGFPEYILESILIYHCPKMEWSRNGIPAYTVRVNW